MLKVILILSSLLALANAGGHFIRNGTKPYPAVKPGFVYNAVYTRGANETRDDPARMKIYTLCNTGTHQQRILCYVQNGVPFTVTENLGDPQNQFFHKGTTAEFQPGSPWGFANKHPTGIHYITISNAFALGLNPPEPLPPYAGADGQMVGKCSSITNDFYECDAWTCDIQFIFFKAGVVPCQNWNAGCQIYSDYANNVLLTIFMSGVEAPCASGDTTFKMGMPSGTDAAVDLDGDITMFQPLAYDRLTYTFNL